jgi:hypothetical protein
MILSATTLAMMTDTMIGSRNRTSSVSSTMVTARDIVIRVIPAKNADACDRRIVGRAAAAAAAS